MYIILLFIFITQLSYFGLYYLTIKHKNYKKRKITFNYFFNTYINYIILEIFLIIIILNKEKIFSKQNTPILQNIIPILQNIIFYFLIIDALYYWYHFTVHRIPILKKYIHSDHHNVNKLLPLDILNCSIIENIMNFLTLNVLALFIVKLSIIEYVFITWLVFIETIYIHYDTNRKFIYPLFVHCDYHKYHHEIGKGNYSIMFSIWDDYMGTRIYPSSKKEKEKKKKIKEKKKKIKEKKIKKERLL